MDEIRERVKTIESEKGLLELINEIGKEEMGENFHPFTFQQFCFYSITDGRVPTEKRYHTFKIPKKKKGEFREISSPVRQLKNIQYLIKIILEEIYKPKECVMGFVKQRSVVDNAKKHLNRCYVQNLDIKDFFPSVSQEMILRCLHFTYKINSKVASMIARLCCIRREDGSIVLPQGSPTSPIIANMVFEKLDDAIMILAKDFHLDYTRYADDMTFSGEYNAFKDEGSFMKRLSSIIEQNGFKLNPDKKRIQKHGSRQEVTGIIISSKTNVRRKYVKEIRVMLHNWEFNGYEQANKCFSECYIKKVRKKYPNPPDIKNVLDGKLEYLKMVKGIGDMTYLRLKERFDRLVSQSDERD